MNKLAEIVKITSLEPIPDADRIERATVLGWSVVVGKGLHKVDDLAVMIFPDTLIPKKYVDPKHEGDEKIRLKTVRIKKQYSAGLIIPIRECLPIGNYSEGDDVSGLLDVIKYEHPDAVKIAGNPEGSFPSHLVHKTDEDHYRTNPRAFEELQDDRFKDVRFVATLKCDGSSATFILHNNEFKVCSRNLTIKESDDNAFWYIAKKYKIEEVLRNAGVEYAIQGELCGPAIQSNPMQLDEKKLFVFQIKDLQKQAWLSYDSVLEFCSKNGLLVVEEILRVENREALPSREELQEISNKTKYNNGKVDAEGIVLRPVKPIESRALGKPWSVKIPSEPYDLKK